MKLKLANLILIISIFSLSLFAQSEQIEWQKDFKKAVAQAKETGRPLLLDFTAVWCEPCKAMDAEFWVLPKVIQAVKPFIAVKIDIDSEIGLANKYKANSIPLVVFTDPLGNVVTSSNGFSTNNVNQLNRILELMPKDFSSLKKQYEAIEKNKNDYVSLLQIADAYRSGKMFTLSNDFYKKALKTKEIQNNTDEKERAMANLGINEFNSGFYNEAIENLEDYIKSFPQGLYIEISYYFLTVSNHKMGKKKNAIKYLDLLKQNFPTSKYIPTAEKAIEESKNKKEK
jgi:thiol-disulfide isomerase/thioredoxin